MKKIISFVIALTMVFCFAGCGENEKSDSNSVPSSTPTAESTESNGFYLGDLRVNEIALGKPNSAGGVSLALTWKNGDKDIKYITFTFDAYNAVGDKVCDTITNSSTKKLKLTGPIPADYFYTYATLENGKVIYDDTKIFENFWYNPTITNCKLTEISIDYMDGTHDLIKGDYLDYVQGNFNG